MNIYAMNGDKLTVTKETIENGYDSVTEHAKKHLKVGGVYTVNSTTVHSWSTSVELVEFPNEIFDSVSFIDFDETNLD